MSLQTDIRNFYQQSGIASRYVLINLAVYIILLLIGVIGELSAWPVAPSVAAYLSAPSDLQMLLRQPWSVFTYMFVHIQFGHFIFNMIMLYFAGMIFITLLGSRKLPGVYVLGGLCGFLMYFFIYNLSPAPAFRYPGILMGASASIMAIWVAAGSFRPNYSVHLMLVGPVKIYILILIYVIIDLARLAASAGVAGANAGGWLSHIGGAGFGAVFGLSLRKGRDITRFFDNWLDVLRGLFRFSKKKKRPIPKSSHTATGSFRSNSPYVTRDEKKKKIDRILDKISKSGYESLTAAEKDFLFNNSKDV